MIITNRINWTQDNSTRSCAGDTKSEQRAEFEQIFEVTPEELIQLGNLKDSEFYAHVDASIKALKNE